ncbi:MAG: GDSL-type esterase/lipase family protein [Solirubrobacteraceae bacterium]|nr:GDSL-type esterase/lipase family protein [Solirubrobacteraceae bacterium]
MQADRRVLFFGDSFAAGVGDPTGLGWVGRVVAAAHAAGLPLTAYDLGVRGDTTLDVAARWQAETAARTRAVDASHGVVLSFGSNDMTEQGRRLRVAPGLAVRTLGRLLDLAEASGCGVFIVGPPPVGERDQDERIRELSSQFAHVATHRRIAFVDTAKALGASAVWTAEAAANDGSHPAAGGYAQLAELVLAGGWLDWLAAMPGVAST